MSSNNPASERYLSSAQLRDLVPLSRQHIYRLIQAGTFPAAIKIGIRKNAWRLSAIQSWLAEREAATPALAVAASQRARAVRQSLPNVME